MHLFFDNIGDPNNLEKFCKQGKTADLSGNERDDEILFKLVKTTVVGNAGSDTVDIQYPRMTMNDYLLQTGDFLFVARKYPNIQLLMNANALMDWGVGLLSSFIQLNTVFESDTCKPYRMAQDMVLDCVCSDKKYSISTSKRKESLIDWSFWCVETSKVSLFQYHSEIKALGPTPGHIHHAPAVAGLVDLGLKDILAHLHVIEVQLLRDCSSDDFIQRLQP